VFIFFLARWLPIDRAFITAKPRSAPAVEEEIFAAARRGRAVDSRCVNG
jgi:hypothetical protein